MRLCLFEDNRIDHLRPLVNTRAVYDLRLGMRTLLETVRDAFDGPPTVLHARPLVAAVTAQEHPHPLNQLAAGDRVLFVNGRFVAEEGPLLERLRRTVDDDETARAFVRGDQVIAAWMPGVDTALAERVSAGERLTRGTFDALPETPVDQATLISRLWHLLETLRPALERDYAARTSPYRILEPVTERPGATVHPSAVGVHAEQIYIAPEATVHAGAVLNAEGGPIFIDRKAKILEQAVVRGPAYVGPRSQVKIGARLECCAIGPWCKVGGEVHDAVMHSLSNKAHSGFLGHSYLGRWCNLGADTNVSNLKNDYGIISLYDPATGAFESTGRQFVGLFMGDHSKTAINTMFNTGTVVGTFCNLFGADFPPRYVPSFTWGRPGAYAEYRFDKALQVAETVMARRNISCTDADRALLTHLFDRTRAEGERSEFRV